MTDFPPPDLRDHAGRLRRLAVATAVGLVAGYFACITSVDVTHPGDQVTDGAFRFVAFVTGLSFMAGFALTIGVLNWRARRRDDQARVPRAKLR